MKVIIEKNKDAGIQTATRIIAACIRSKNAPVLGFPTGSTPIPLYAELVRMHKEEDLDFSRMIGFNCDEWIGVPYDHPGTYHYFMEQHLYSHINVRKENIHIPEGLAPDPDKTSEEYERAIQNAGGLDLMILGLGKDGHIAFNEPMSSLRSRTRAKILSEEIRRDNAECFGSPHDVPYSVITIGIGTILDSRSCLLIAFGKAKADIVATAFEGPLTIAVPASALQLHPNVTVILDDAAASKLRYADFHRYAEKVSASL